MCIHFVKMQPLLSLVLRSWETMQCFIFSLQSKAGHLLRECLALSLAMSICLLVQLTVYHCVCSCDYIGSRGWRICRLSPICKKVNQIWSACWITRLQSKAPHTHKRGGCSFFKFPALVGTLKTHIWIPKKMWVFHNMALLKLVLQLNTTAAKIAFWYELLLRYQYSTSHNCAVKSESTQFLFVYHQITTKYLKTLFEYI